MPPSSSTKSNVASFCGTFLFPSTRLNCFIIQKTVDQLDICIRSHFTAMQLFEGMGGLRISCQSQDMIFWDEMPHILGTYVLEEPASFIFC